MDWFFKNKVTVSGKIISCAAASLRCTQTCASESRKVIEPPQLPKTPFGIRFARSCNARFCLARGLGAFVRSPLQLGANSGR